jgi:hypothetical protein
VTTRALPARPVRATSSDKRPAASAVEVAQPVDISGTIAVQGIDVTGVVRLKSGPRLPHVPVWAERRTGGAADVWQRRMASLDGATLDGSRTLTDERGAFTVRVARFEAPFIVKTFARGYPPGLAGPWDASNLPSAAVEVIVDDGGGWLLGSFLDTTGVLLTNVAAEIWLYEEMEPGRTGVRQEPLWLEIDRDGSYKSGLLEQDSYTFSFNAPGYQTARREARIVAGAATLLEVVFSAMPTFTGQVLDAQTRAPISGVCLAIEDASARAQCNCSPTTDVAGTFTVTFDSWVRLCFRHPTYAFAYREWSAASIRQDDLTVLLSAGGDVLVQAMDAERAPLTNVTVLLECAGGDQQREFSQRALRTGGEGTVLFSNVPTHLGELRAAGMFAGQTPVAEGAPFTPRPGALTQTELIFPACGTLELQFSATLDVRTLQLLLTPRTAGYRGWPYERYDFHWPTQTKACMPDLPAGDYSLTLRAPDLGAFATNFTLSARQTLRLAIAGAGTTTGIICGTLRDARGLPLQASITVRNPRPSGESHYLECNHGDFRCAGLDANALYDLGFNISRGTRTNFVIRAVRPNGPPLAVVLPAAYRVTGRIVDATGTPLAARVNDADTEPSTGEFMLEPVFPGTHSLMIWARGYVPVAYPIAMRDADQDIGAIVVTDPGVRLTGTLVTDTGQPIAGAQISLSMPDPRYPRHYHETSPSCQGNAFAFDVVPAGVQIRIRINTRTSVTNLMVGPFTRDVNLGDIRMPSEHPDP